MNDEHYRLDQLMTGIKKLVAELYPEGSVGEKTTIYKADSVSSEFETNVPTDKNPHIPKYLRVRVDLTQ